MPKLIASALAAALMSFAFLVTNFAGGSALAAKITLKCGKNGLERVTVSGARCKRSNIIEYGSGHSGKRTRKKVGVSVNCKDRKGNSARGGCEGNTAFCDTTAGNTSCSTRFLRRTSRTRARGRRARAAPSPAAVAPSSTGAAHLDEAKAHCQANPNCRVERDDSALAALCFGEHCFVARKAGEQPVESFFAVKRSDVALVANPGFRARRVVGWETVTQVCTAGKRIPSILFAVRKDVPRGGRSKRRR